MRAFFVSVVATLGALVANSASAACLWIFADEPEMPRSMIER